VPAEDRAEIGDERGVVDRIVGGVAVVLVGDEEAEQELDVATLPPGIGEGTWLRVRRSSEGLVVVGKDEEGESLQRQEVAGRLDRLRHERRSGRFGR
jgi:hypothetical protein